MIKKTFIFYNKMFFSKNANLNVQQTHKQIKTKKIASLKINKKNHTSPMLNSSSYWLSSQSSGKLSSTDLIPGIY